VENFQSLAVELRGEDADAGRQVLFGSNGPVVRQNERNLLVPRFMALARGLLNDQQQQQAAHMSGFNPPRRAIAAQAGLLDSQACAKCETTPHPAAANSPSVMIRHIIMSTG